MIAYQQAKTELIQNPKSWLITGVAGFIGSNLLETLLKLDQVVVGLDNFSTGHRHNLDEVHRMVSSKQWARFSFHEGDIRDLKDCRRVATKVNYVLHHAALGSVLHSMENPIVVNEVNVSGFLNMLVASRDATVDRFVFAASSSCYGDTPEQMKLENRIGSPLSPYGVTKFVNELYAEVFAKSYNLSSIGLRYFNIFGPRQDPEGAYAAVIPRWISSLIKGETVFINGDGESSRDFCFVENAVQANILAATVSNTTSLNTVYNIAVGERTTLNELFEFLKNDISRYYNYVHGATPTFRDFLKGDIRHSMANIDKARLNLGYCPQYNAREGLKLSLEWYRGKLLGLGDHQI